MHLLYSKQAVSMAHLEVNSVGLELSLLLSFDLLTSTDVSGMTASVVVLVYSTHRQSTSQTMQFVFTATRVDKTVQQKTKHQATIMHFISSTYIYRSFS